METADTPNGSIPLLRDTRPRAPQALHRRRQTVVRRQRHRFPEDAHVLNAISTPMHLCTWMLDRASARHLVPLLVALVTVGGDFDFVRAGKIPGLAGGRTNTGGRKPDGTDGWSARMMWRTSPSAAFFSVPSSVEARRSGRPHGMRPLPSTNSSSRLSPYPIDRAVGRSKSWYGIH